MFCHNCGNQLNGHEKFCPHCGCDQKNQFAQAQPGNYGDGRGKGQGSGGPKVPLALVVILILAVVIVMMFVSDRDTEERVSQEPANVQEERQPVVQMQPETEPQIIKDGWVEENGKRYYYDNGEMYVDLQEIQGELYYFEQDGTLVTNDEIDCDGYTLEAGSDGRIEAVMYDAIGGDWADEKYHFGNNGTSSVMELSVELEDCDYCTLYLEADGKYGATVDGDWKVYIRHNGQWEHVKTISFSEPSGYHTIRFKTPQNFDAITAHPTKQGNASYSALFYLTDVHCLF